MAIIVYKDEFSPDELKNISNEFKRIGNFTYLDHTGTTLYSEKQIELTTKTLNENLLCNPHTCKIAGDLINQVRNKVLEHFNTNSDEYDVIFTSGATASLKLVAECFNFGSNGSFYYCQENHTSVLGMRTLVKTQNISVLTVDEILENITDDSTVLLNNSCGDYKISSDLDQNDSSLITFSAQCNATGYKLPLEVIPLIQNKGLKNYGYFIQGQKSNQLNEENYVCLDAASFLSANFLDLTLYKPDYFCLSFYKIFGYPTGLGALIVSKRGKKLLKKHYYGGGTVLIVLSREVFHHKRKNFVESFEDGTVSFLSICALIEGFKTLERLVPSVKNNSSGSIERISEHVFNLAKYCFESMKLLKYRNGQNLVKFFNHTNFESKKIQGGILCFNVVDENGSDIGFSEIACLAAVHNIILRVGCFCNSGVCQNLITNLSGEKIKLLFSNGFVCNSYEMDLAYGISIGGVRLSFGYMSKKEDVDYVVGIIKKFYLIETKQSRTNKLINANLPIEFIPLQYKYKIRELQDICLYPIELKIFSIEKKVLWELCDLFDNYQKIYYIADSTGLPVKYEKCLMLKKISMKSTNSGIELNFKEMKSIYIPLENKIDNPSTDWYKICGYNVKCLDYGDNVSNWLKSYLNVTGLRLLEIISLTTKF